MAKIAKKKTEEIKEYKFAFFLKTSSHVNEDGYFFTATDKKNNIVHSNINLAKKFGKDKFEPLDPEDYRRRTPFVVQHTKPVEDKPVPEQDEDDKPEVVKAERKQIENSFAEMETDELKKYAKKNDIDLGDASTKDEVLAKVLEFESLSDDD